MNFKLKVYVEYKTHTFFLVIFVRQKDLLRFRCFLNAPTFQTNKIHSKRDGRKINIDRMAKIAIGLNLISFLLLLMWTGKSWCSNASLILRCKTQMCMINSCSTALCISSITEKLIELFAAKATIFRFAKLIDLFDIGENCLKREKSIAKFNYSTDH